MSTSGKEDSMRRSSSSRSPSNGIMRWLPGTLILTWVLATGPFVLRVVGGKTLPASNVVAVGVCWLRSSPMAKDRMPIWQSSMRWISDVLADGDAWQKALIYLLFLVLL